MSDTLANENLAADWVTALAKVGLAVWQEKRFEFSRIFESFGDMELLAGSYIEPDCQPVNPADFHEDEPLKTWTLRVPIRNWINEFLKAQFLERDGRNTLFVLSDAGMGKSSLLMMLKFSHLMRFWPSKLDFKLLKLGEQTLGDLEKINDRKNTVLLLDSLDEDPTAWGRIEDRLGEILHAVKTFRQAIVTCRTQFFPRGGKTSIERPGKVEFSGFECNLLYLSPFSDQQVERYLESEFPDSWGDRIRRKLKKEANCRLEEARSIAGAMKSLRVRPMLLAYVKDLMEADVENWKEYSIYQSLVNRWLLREERKDNAIAKKEDLKRACFAVALFLQETGKRTLGSDDLEELVGRQPVARKLTSIEIGGRSLLNKTSDGFFRFSHYSIQEFLVVSGLVEGGYQPSKAIRGTDQIYSFLVAYIAEDPRRRLSEVDWDVVDLKDIAVPVADFTGLDLSDVNLAKNVVRRADFSNSDLSRVDLSRRDLSECKFRGAVLFGANFRGSVLKAVDLMGAQVQDANFESADLTGATLGGANVVGACFDSAEITYLNLTQANLEGVDLRKTKGLNLARLSGARMAGVNLDGLDLRGAVLERVDLRNSSLRNVDLRKAKLNRTNLRGADLRGADLSGVNLFNATINSGDLEGARVDLNEKRRIGL